jgi:hypothetical protein
MHDMLMSTINDLEAERDRLRACLIRIYYWQAEVVNDVLPSPLSKECVEVLGKKTIQLLLNNDLEAALKGEKD